MRVQEQREKTLKLAMRNKSLKRKLAKYHQEKQQQETQRLKELRQQQNMQRMKEQEREDEKRKYYDSLKKEY